MPENNSPDFGRKIFFLNPSYKIKNHVVKELRELEYEVYEIENYKFAKNILRHNPNSILFINTDSQMILTTWLAFMKSFSEEEALKTIKLGIVSERILKDIAELIFDMLDLEAGITSMSGDLSKLLEVIKGILELHGAKGRRNYVRCPCTNDKNAQLFWTHRGKMHQFKILDLSSVTVGVRIPSTLTENLNVGTVLENVQMVIGTRVIAIDLSVYIVKDTPNGKVAILLYGEKTDPIVKTRIKEFIALTLQTYLISGINGEEEDSTDYLLLAKQDQHMMEFEREKKNAKKPPVSKKEGNNEAEAATEEQKEEESATEEQTEGQKEEEEEEKEELQKEDEQPKNEEKDNAE